MGALPDKFVPNRNSSTGNKSILKIIAILGVIACVGLAYMVVFVSPNEVVERVEVIAVIDSGCIVETFDGYAINIGKCNAQPGEIIMAPIDQKVKQREYAMNPTD